MLEAFHLFANHKVTGPAELALETARWLPLCESSYQTCFYSASPSVNKDRDRWLQILARKRGLREPRFSDVKLSKHFNPFAAWRDMRRLGAHWRSSPPALLHVHSNNDHLIGGLALRKLQPHAPIIRTCYEGDPPAASYRLNYCLRHLTDHLICFSRRVADSLLERGTGLQSSQVTVLSAPIDTTRFDPAREVPDLRQVLEIPQEAPVYGIVARMQTHRRFELLIEAMSIVKRARPDARAIIVGRGTNQQAVARDPVARAGLSDHVLFSGYLEGEHYVGVLKALDMKVYLVPGSDGTCRAAREALAMGRPVIASARGMLPEIVADGETGRIVGDRAEDLAEGILALIEDPDQRRRLGDEARRRSLESGSFQAFCKSLAGIYAKALDSSSGA